MKYIISIFLLILILFISISPIIACEIFSNRGGNTYEGDDCGNLKAEMGDWEEIGEDEWNQVNWEEINQEDVPADYIDRIPADKVDVTKVSDPSKLKADQLAYGNNLDQIDPNKLNKDARDQAIKLKTGKETDLETSKPGSTLASEDSLRLDNADRVRIDDLYAENADGIYSGPEDYYEIEYADYIETLHYSINKGYGVKGTNNDLFLSSAGKFKVVGAKTLSVGGYEFNDIGLSSFALDDGRLVSAYVLSSKDNNTFDLGNALVIIDTGEQFSAEFSPDKSITITTEDPARIDADKETVITLTERIDPGRNITGDVNRSTFVRAVGKNTVVIDHVLGVVAVHLAPTGRYISYESNDKAEPFSIFSLPDSAFDFYLKKHPEQIINANMTTCVNCGLYDMHENMIYLNGRFEYERLDDNNNFVDVIKSKTADNKIALLMDANMNKIKTATFTGTLAYFFSGPFEVKIENNVNYYNYHEFGSLPYVIQKINPLPGNEVVFDEAQGYMMEEWNGGRFRMYDNNKEEVHGFLKRWHELQSWANEIRAIYEGWREIS